MVMSHIKSSFKVMVVGEGQILAFSGSGNFEISV